MVVWACSETTEDMSQPSSKTETAQEWVEKVVREHYYWYQDVPDKEKLDFNADVSDFFNSLLSDKDGKEQRGVMKHFSWLEKISTSKAYQGARITYGLEFVVYGKMACILYVLPSSPAEMAGLKRGEWIATINGQPLTLDNADNLHLGGKIELSIYQEKPGNQYVFDRVVTLEPACQVEDNPILLDTVYGYDNHNVAYLVYNHFTPGPNGPSDEKFNNSLRKTFAKFASKGVDELILDLRYNGGGQSSCAALLASMIVPYKYMNHEFCHMQYNDKHTEKNGVILFDESYIYKEVQGANLDLQRIFILTGRQTASSSELVINCLRPYMDVVLIGDKTFGKNVAFEEIRNSDIGICLHLIVAQAFNKNGFSEYEDGFQPLKGNMVIESAKPLKELGDVEESLLNHALQQIRGK